MTKKLEEEFNLPPIEEVTDMENVPTVEETQEVIQKQRQFKPLCLIETIYSAS